MNEHILTVLKKLEKRSRLEENDQVKVKHEDRMLAITEDTGQFFNLFLKAIKAKRVLEIGTSVGYSTLWFADALLENGGIITTIEQNSSKISRSKANFKEAKVDHIIKNLQGEAIKILKQLSESEKENQFDFAFLDADKELNSEYFDIILPMIKVGGIIATDNILYPEKFRPIMSKFIDHVKKIPNVQTFTLALGNGEQITLKTG
ncbi:MAG TPA: O-methyltransferase [Nitrosopumilaceae archaeon]|nr:O-methyltransferase [Nitrosopumilaceae archaeon]